MFFVRSIVFNMQIAPPVLLLPSGGPITGATVSVLKEYLTAQGTQPEARAQQSAISYQLVAARNGKEQSSDVVLPGCPPFHVSQQLI